MVSAPDGRDFLGVDLGTDAVRVCTLEDGVPVVLHETSLQPGSGPRHLALHPHGPFAYVLNELAATITVCRWNAPAGPLEALGEAPVLSETPEGDAYPSGILTSPDGRFVWTATRGTNVLTWFTVDPETGIPVRAGSIEAPAASCVVLDV